MSNPAFTVVIFAITTLLFFDSGNADDWPRFRGAQGSGAATDSNAIPNVWSPLENIAWKSRLPGPGASSPIVVGKRVFVTCYSGYGVTKEQQSNLEDLVRHLICIDLTSGAILWQNNIEASLPEDSYYRSGVSSHGYASHTPVSDGKNVYAFFGKGGVFAFDLDGNELWRASAGKESDPPKWGSSSSPILYRNTLIVTASAESQSVIGFDTQTGEEKWRQSATGLNGMWGTPILVPVNETRTDLVMLVPGEIWGLDPTTGKLRWHSTATKSQHAYSSVIADGNRVYAFSGQGGGSVAIDAGGTGNVSDTHLVWNGPVNAVYGSPIRYESDLYIIARGILSTVDTATGKRGFQMRLKGERKTGNARFGSLDYASPIVVGDRMLYLNASGQVYVFQLGSNIELLAVNEVTSEKEVFWGSPAASDGRLFLRSSKYLYCIANSDRAGSPAPVVPKFRTFSSIKEANSSLPTSNVPTTSERPKRPEPAEDED